MADIFLSYKREDRDKVRPLVEALQAQGWSVWWDTRIDAGEIWDEVIETQLKAAKCVVVVWSKLSVHARWVRAEALKGLERDCLVPVALEGVDLPVPFNTIQTIDLARWKGDAADAAFANLCAGVRRILERQGIYVTQTAPSDRKEARAHNNRGKAHYDSKDYDLAISDYTKAVEADPKYAVAFRNRGDAHFQRKDYDLAISDYTKAIDIDPEDAGAYINRGDARRSKGDLDRAIDDYTTAIEIDPKNVPAYSGRADSYSERQDLDRAIADYNRVVELSLGPRR